MTLNLPSRQLLKGASALTSSTTYVSSSSSSPNSLLLSLASLSLTSSPASSRSHGLHTSATQQWFWNRNKVEETPLEKQLVGGTEARKQLMKRLSGKLESPSIFDEERKATKAATKQVDIRKDGTAFHKPTGAFTRAGASLVKEHMARAVDPDPRSRVRWERKMAIREVTRGTNAFSTEPRKARIARTERVLTNKSPWLPTSVKKLVMLARQIKGKRVDDALVQMKFSKKKMAREVTVSLKESRDQAIAERGMGLGLRGGDAIHYQDKDGKHMTVTDPSTMYVAEAWVNRGPWRGIQPEYRARGNINRLMKPSTSISIVLKEEKTRIREHNERVAKKLRQKVWVHLPDRPVTAQRQYYSW
ncbi:ribosomal protein L22/L17 [Podospora didyma]|uniref:Ribosomal protein L22/L17 n=1 Tax=Podospora didyma TaxID=330526 RepID=A0AAE0P8G1_9PEZI|nr:ribosomal protein L22/L17 [Podospora didyma]